MADIPYDIWKQVAECLSSEDVKGLLTINRALFDIAMDERYRACQFGSLLHSSTLRTLGRLCDPLVAHRVRVFRLVPGHLFKLLKEQEETDSAGSSAPSSALTTLPSGGQSRGSGPTSSRSRRSRHLIRGPTSSAQRFSQTTNSHSDRSIGAIINQPLISPGEALEQLYAVVEHLTSLITLNVEIRGEEHYYMANSKALLFDFVWPAVAASLQRLELRIPIEDMAIVLPDPHVLTLTRLESLYLRIIRASLTTEEQPIILDVLVPFLNAHSATLRSLTLDTVEQTDLSFFLSAVQLPHLRELKLRIPLAEPADPRFTVLRSFFRSHRSQLTSFEIELLPTFTHRDADPAFFAQDHFSTYRPKLQHLNVTTPSYTASISSYILQFRWTLVSLKVHPTHRWSLDSLRTLVEAFLSSGTLTQLEVAVSELSPELLVTLAVNLPNLDYLRLDFNIVRPNDMLYSPEEAQDVPLFYHVMSDVEFPQWRLKTLITTSLHPNHDIRTLYKKAILRSLPNVTNFSGMGRGVYLQTTAFI